MRTISNVIKGDLEVSADTHLLGIVAGSVVVHGGANFLLDGIVSGDVTLASGSSATLRGTVGGSVLNNGGRLEILGIVTGSVQRKDGQTRIDAKAVVGMVI